MKKAFAVILLVVGLVGAGSGTWFVFDMDTLSDTVAEVRQSVVHIEKVGKWEGSGFVLSEDGLICTAKHVVEGGGEFIVTFDDGTKFTTHYALADSQYDIGFLKIEPRRMLVPLPLSTFDLRAGDPVFIMGSPLGFENFNSITLGVVSSTHRGTADDNGLGWQVLFQSDAAAYPGNSGGPVFTMGGAVVGVLVAGMDASLNYSIPVDVFADELDVIKLKFSFMRFGIPQLDKIKDLEYRVTSLEQWLDQLMQKDSAGNEEPETYDPEKL